MRLRECLLGTPLMSIALVTTIAGAPTVLGDHCRPDLADNTRSSVEAKTSESLPAAPSPLISEDKLLGSAYYDTVNILGSNNPCSDFFGGPASVEVFNELVSKIGKSALSVGIGMRMSGSTTNIHNARTKMKYRIFDKVTINSRGPFYRRKAAPWEPTVPKVGTFEPNTKEVRVLMLLHELGHVMTGSDGQWLLPDDGKDEGLSRANSRKIEDVCVDQLHSLGKVGTKKDPVKYKDPDQQLARVSTSESTQPEPQR
ncbi:MAG: hypothetical protein ND895_26745 [Pyrinomonadaceae bacterium]|nr:hypothetical protein [Pyrinomonadaceae bacterium]